MRGASNREKLKEFYKSKAREEAELVRNPEINLNSSEFGKKVKNYKFSNFHKKLPPIN